MVFCIFGHKLLDLLADVVIHCVAHTYRVLITGTSWDVILLEDFPVRLAFSSFEIAINSHHLSCRVGFQLSAACNRRLDEGGMLQLGS